MSEETVERRQVVRYAFYRVDPAWRRLAPADQVAQKAGFAAAIVAFGGRMLVRSYSLVGVRGDADFMLWQVAEDLDTLMALQSDLNRTGLGAFLAVPYSYLAVTRRSIYDIPAHPGGGPRPDPSRVQPGDARYLFVYPFAKTRDWYALSREERQQMINEHIVVGRRHPRFRLNTTYSYGLDDQEFVVAFEGDDPAGFVDLVMELRDTKASRFTLRDTPSFACIRCGLEEVLDALGGPASASGATAGRRRGDGFVEVARLEELPPGSSRRVYAWGETVALFNVEGAIHALGNRCPHARASLSEGNVSPEEGLVTCPWHEGRFDLATGRAVAGPPASGVSCFPVKVEDGVVLVGPASARGDA